MKIKTMSVVRLDWQDHYSNNSGWMAKEYVDQRQFKPVICSSVGLVINQDKDQIVLAQNWHPPFSDDDDWKFADFMVVIKKCIKKVTVYKKKETK